MSLLPRHKGQFGFGNGQNGRNDNGGNFPSQLLPLSPESRFVTSGGVTFCNLHKTFATRCGCCDGLKEAKLVTEKPKFPLVRCHRCFRLTDQLIQFAVPWSVAFVDGVIDLLGKGVCVDCYRDLVLKTARALTRYRFPFLCVRPALLWGLPAWAALALSAIANPS